MYASGALLGELEGGARAYVVLAKALALFGGFIEPKVADGFGGSCCCFALLASDTPHSLFILDLDLC